MNLRDPWGCWDESRRLAPPAWESPCPGRHLGDPWGCTVSALSPRRHGNPHAQAAMEIQLRNECNSPAGAPIRKNVCFESGMDLIYAPLGVLGPLGRLGWIYFTLPSVSLDPWEGRDGFILRSHRCSWTLGEAGVNLFYAPLGVLEPLEGFPGE